MKKRKEKPKTHPHTPRVGHPPRIALLRFWFVVQLSAHGQRIIRVDGAIAFFDMLNHAVFIDHNIGALSPLIGLILFIIAFENAVGCQHFLVHVA